MDKKRCKWCLSSDKMIHYHDTYWGVPVHDDQELFAKLILDMNQAGLSWSTILNKMETFYEAYDQFNICKIASYDKEKEEELRQNSGIIRNKLKIAAAINNAQIVLDIQKEFGSFNAYIWSFTKGKVLQHKITDESQVPVTNGVAEAMSKDMKKRGMKFVGPTIIYAYLQAIGVINDHAEYCFRNKELQ
ncbi:MAG TPA: 3-methyladenine DNA glycosylase [Lactococcus sp.]|uniref:DNA-3-methyladenine glycosylase I n=1 Tax=Lactococcus TaxID=1357 RepID=UPI000E879DD1|nr:MULTISPECIES: DNA-3-methyladenine glycosylase I [Lactococcus]HAP15330.1 3-methyladenine DNA glycosylase [Lactococcus sp.]HBC90643.1 3-methyladenine DNA glycosylase [Lactococcus sp.]